MIRVRGRDRTPEFIAGALAILLGSAFVTCVTLTVETDVQICQDGDCEDVDRETTETETGGVDIATTEEQP